MRPKETCFEATKDMEIAFQNILEEIIEHVIEGICFETHRAIKLGYFAYEEYILKEHEFEPYENDSKQVQKFEDTLKDTNKRVFSVCPICNQKKAANILVRHMRKCDNNNSSLDNSAKTENSKNSFDENKSDGRKGNDTKRQAKSTPTYDTMSPEQIQDFLLKHCGVVSLRSGKPCSNSLKCGIHLEEDRKKVRGSSPGDHSADGNIDIDTVD